MKDVEQKTKEEELERRFRELAEGETALDQSKQAHWFEVGRVAGMESGLKIVQAKANEEGDELVGWRVRSVARESSLDERIRGRISRLDKLRMDMDAEEAEEVEGERIASVESEEQAHGPETPASEKRKREERMAKGRKRLSTTGLEQLPPSRGSDGSSGRDSVTEVRFGAPLVLNLGRASEPLSTATGGESQPPPPVLPMPPPSPSPAPALPPPPPAQPVQSSSSAQTAPPAQVPSWVSVAEVPAELRPVWGRLEFSHPKHVDY